ncbi:hypothetical protein CYMTET_21298 [Cymbomonas tetramitiformis]|uniref:Uncharacterized protein n=1 Tax=Cymbomonas tetramitiformis TaxID=36881 RepID=A0AAE0G2E1_9CHLO|nr:hypothetical protein CYMTET_21298 [Cymbomonas tetramitiformis]
MLEEEWNRVIDGRLECSAHARGGAGHRRETSTPPKAKRLRKFCAGEGREWLPALEETVRLYVASLLQKGKVEATSMQSYLSAINNYYEDMGTEGLQAAITLLPEDDDKLPWLHACTYVVLALNSFGRSDMGTARQREHVLVGDDKVTAALAKEKGRNHRTLNKKLPIPWWRVEQLRELLELWTRQG